MHITYRNRATGAVTVAAFERHTMSRTMRRYPAMEFEPIGADFNGAPVRLVGSRVVSMDTLLGRLLGM